MSINSANFNNIVWFPAGIKCSCMARTLDTGWYFWDETGQLGGGPYTTERLANEFFKQYVKRLDAEGKDST